jgi:putative hemolysin
MFQIELRKIIDDKYPNFLKNFPSFLKKTIIYLLEIVLHLKRINNFLRKHGDKEGVLFIDELFEWLNFTYLITQKDRLKIPSEGRLIIVSNHPLGALDGLSIIRAIKEVRSDVKIVANNVLLSIRNLDKLFIPVDLENKGLKKESLNNISNSLQNEEALIIFPAGEVSRLKWGKISDGKWNKGAIYFSKKYNTPILPIYINGKNSFLFYFFDLFGKNISKLLLPHEIFTKVNSSIQIKIGDFIPYQAFKFQSSSTQIKLLKKHVYRIGNNKKGLFKTSKNIIHPIDKKIIKNDLSRSKIIGKTEDGKKILIIDYNESEAVINEIARLREQTFRIVGEGTGNRLDIDKFDKYYKHLILWDDDKLEIVGSYRIGICKDIIQSFGKNGLYSSSLFQFSEDFDSYFDNSIELGRSFIQQKYWNSNALDYLWKGIGAYLSDHPEIKYMFGAVSISNSYIEDAKSMLVYFFYKWYGAENNMIESKNKYLISQNKIKFYQDIFNVNDIKEDFKILKYQLKCLGFSIPTLYKQYTDLCYDGGVKFYDFGIDKDFGNCLDGLIFIEIDKIKKSKKERYFKEKEKI